ncbi:MAG: hypothetical protein C0519_14410 [Hyphomicrobium sp.]|nr:hypothetical protein [Hyphomicrobium sp.]PPD06065.1 MAG: hypothetical protein CTY28_15050 [Hyphomicrobium sp.]
MSDETKIAIMAEALAAGVVAFGELVAETWSVDFELDDGGLPGMGSRRLKPHQVPKFQSVQLESIKWLAALEQVEHGREPETAVCYRSGNL